MNNPTPVIPIPKATIMISRREQSTSTQQCWLMQLHPMDLEQGKIELGRNAVTIGRSPECDIHLEDDSVSREHAKIQWTPAGHQITDLQSTNGVLVNDNQVSCSALTSGDRVQLGQRIFRFLVDNDEESKYYETVYSMMTRDGLTGAFNKRYLIECLDREIVRSREYGRPISVVLIDVDHFKSVNDTHGHLAGDEVLRELSLRIQSQIRDGAVFARFGGEEFAIVAPEMNNSNATQLAEACRHAVGSKAFETSAGELEITASFGVASPGTEDLKDRNRILELADSRLYEAKRSGRNRVVAN